MWSKRSLNSDIIPGEIICYQIFHPHLGFECINVKHAAMMGRRLSNPRFLPIQDAPCRPCWHLEGREIPGTGQISALRGWNGHVEPAASSSLQQTNVTEMDFQKGPQMCFLTFSALWTNHCLWQASLLLEAWPGAGGGKVGVLFIISLEKHCTLTTQGSNCPSLLSDTLWKREKALESQVKRLILLKHSIEANSLCLEQSHTLCPGKQLSVCQD